ncbi:hypothetical protein D3C80_1996310 [compost metagenome]
MEKAPLMIAWLAMMVARVARITKGICIIGGHRRKKIFWVTSAPERISAACPA